MLKIWLVTIGEPLVTDAENKKLRTAILAEKLLERGHAVLSFVSAFDHLKKKWIYKKDTREKITEKYSLYILKGCGYKRNIAFKRFLDHRLISLKFKQIAPTLPKPDVIILSMPPHDLSYQVVKFAHQNHIPVIVDIRDPWPDIFIEAFPKQLGSLMRLILAREFYFVKKTMQIADGLLATTSTLLQWGLSYAGRKKTLHDAVFYLGHKKITQLNENEIPQRFIQQASNINEKFIIFFVGTIAHYHNPLILVEAAKKLSEITDIHFVIAGNGELHEELKKKSSGLQNVTLTGWLNDNEIEFWLQKSSVGVCTTPKNVDILPNKTGTYLSSNLPIISAFQGDLKHIIEKYQIGFNYQPNNVEELVSAIMTLYNDKVLYQTMSENAKKVFDTMFDANKVYEEYVIYIENMVKQK